MRQFLSGGVRVCLSVAGADWYTAIYTNALANIDLIFIGMTVAKIKVTGKRTAPENILKMAKAIAWIMFFALTIVNMYLYGVAGEKELFVYRMILPSFYALIGGVLLLLPGAIHSIMRGRWLFLKDASLDLQSIRILFTLCILQYFAICKIRLLQLHGMENCRFLRSM